VTSSPFFSIVIPTRNRSHLVGYAVKSVLNQTFADYEIVVADNDIGNATTEVISRFDDPRVRHLRSGNLPMVDNWEFGRSYARGEYLIILEDKQVLKPKALERLYHSVENERHKIVTWLVDLFYDVGSQYRFAAIHRNATRQERVVSSQEVIKLLLESNRSQSKLLLPRGFNSCCHRSLVETIVKGPAGRLNLPVAPDYTMSFLQLAYCDQQLHIDEALVVSGVGESNGISFVRKAKSAKAFIEETGGEDVFYDRVPIKALLINNVIYNDFLRIRDLAGGNLAGFDLDLVNYFVQCYGDIAEARGKYGVDMTPEEAAWEGALRDQASSIQSDVRRAVKTVQETMRNRLATEKRNRIKSRAKSLGRRVGLQKLRRPMKAEGEPQRQPAFSDILSAIEWEERNSHSLS
jgi:glycosyltransferase involved in cell wall biosynthesis